MTSAFDVWVASLGGSVSADAMMLLRRVFDEHGPVSPDETERIGRAYQLAAAREAVRLVVHDIAATTELEAPPFEYRAEESGVRLSYWGQYATTPVHGLTQADVTVEVADFMQGEVMEDLHQCWPECLDHRTGLHPSRSSDRAAWICRAGGHIVADIGELASQRG